MNKRYSWDRFLTGISTQIIFEQNNGFYTNGHVNSFLSTYNEYNEHNYNLSCNMNGKTLLSLGTVGWYRVCSVPEKENTICNSGGN